MLWGYNTGLLLAQSPNAEWCKQCWSFYESVHYFPLCLQHSTPSPFLGPLKPPWPQTMRNLEEKRISFPNVLQQDGSPPGSPVLLLEEARGLQHEGVSYMDCLKWWWTDRRWYTMSSILSQLQLTQIGFIHIVPPRQLYMFQSHINISDIHRVLNFSWYFLFWNFNRKFILEK